MLEPIRPQRFVVAVVAFILAATSGCAIERPKTAEAIGRWQAIQEVREGQLRLNCGTSCSASWRLARSDLKGLYANQLWEELAVSVVHIGYESNLAYFYLARAAEATASRKAAELYFRLSLASTTSCRGWIFNDCDGVDLPAESSAGLARVNAK